MVYCDAAHSWSYLMHLLSDPLSPLFHHRSPISRLSPSLAPPAAASPPSSSWCSVSPPAPAPPPPPPSTSTATFFFDISPSCKNRTPAELLVTLVPLPASHVS